MKENLITICKNYLSNLEPKRGELSLAQIDEVSEDIANAILDDGWLRSKDCLKQIVWFSRRCKNCGTYCGIRYTKKIRR